MKKGMYLTYSLFTIVLLLAAGVQKTYAGHCSIYFATTSLADATTGIVYSQTMDVEAYHASATFALESGSLPAGLMLDTTTGTISGMPTQTGQYQFTISAKDVNSCTANADLSINVVCGTDGATLNLPTTKACDNDDLIFLEGGSPGSGVYSGTGVMQGAFNPNAGTQLITYTVTDIYNCQQQASATITVNTAPVVTLANFEPLCSNAGNVELTGGLPMGGTYTGTGVIENQFNTNYVGPQTITYTYTDNNNCTAQATNTLVVNSAPEVGLADQQSICQGSNAVTLQGGVPEGGTYSGKGVTDGQFSPVYGSQTISYTVTNNNNCIAQASKVIVVNGPPDVNLGDFMPLCNNGGAITLTGGTPSGGTYTGTGVTGNSFDPTLGTQTVTYTYTDNNQCTAAAVKTITVNMATGVTLDDFTPLCSNANPVTLTQGAPAGGVYSGTGVTYGMYFDPTAGTQIITYTFTDNNTCTTSNSKTITVNTAPTVTLAPFATACSGSEAIVLTGGLPAGGEYTGTGVTNNMFNPSVGTQTIQYEYTDGNNCTVTAQQPLTVDVCTGIKEIVADAMSCFPNPALNSVTVKVTQELQGEINVRLMDVTGKVLATDEQINTQGTYQKTFDLNHFAAGMYMIEIRNGDTLTTRKIVKE